MSEEKDLLFLRDPLVDLDKLVCMARGEGATRLLILAGKPLVYRVGRELSPPLSEEVVHFRQTQSLAEALLSAEQATTLDKDGAVEIDYASGGDLVSINIFFGDGAHNLIVFLA